MTWEDLKRKLSSRKFWTALAGFVTSLLYSLHWAETEVTQAVGVITAAGVVVAYLLAEGSIDTARAENQGGGSGETAPAIGFVMEDEQND